MPRRIRARARNRTVAFGSRGVHRKLLRLEHRAKRRVLIGNEAVLGAHADRRARIIDPVLERVAFRRVGRKRRRVVRAVGSRAFHPARACVFHELARRRKLRHRRRNRVGAFLEMRDVDVASSLSVGELGLCRHELALKRVPANERVARRGRRLQLDVGTAIGQDAARRNRAAFGGARHRQTHHIERLERSGDRAVIGIELRALRDQSAFLFSAHEQPIFVPTPEKPAGIVLSLQVKRFPQFELIGVGLHLGAVAGHRSAPPRIGGDDNLGALLEHRRVGFVLRHAYAQLGVSVVLAGAILPIGEPMLVVGLRLDGDMSSVGQLDPVLAGIAHDRDFARRVDARKQAVDLDFDCVHLRDVFRANMGVAFGNEFQVRLVGAHKHIARSAGAVPAFEGVFLSHVLVKVCGEHRRLANNAGAVACDRALTRKRARRLHRHRNLAGALELRDEVPIVFSEEGVGR